MEKLFFLTSTIGIIEGLIAHYVEMYTIFLIVSLITSYLLYNSSYFKKNKDTFNIILWYVATVIFVVNL